MTSPRGPVRRARIGREAATTTRKDTLMQVPSAGRIVHYVSYGTPGGEYSRECRAAVVTQATGVADSQDREHVGLCVMNPGGLFFNQGVPCDLGTRDNAGGTNLCDGLDFPGGTWHWPART